MPWDVIDNLNAGGRPLVSSALWTEPREALAERENVVVIWGYEPYHGETVIDARDLVGKIWEYRYFAAACIALKPNTGYAYYPNAWATECEAEDWDWEGPACERLTFGATEAHLIIYENWPFTFLGYWHATNVFTAAGLANPRWTLQPAETRVLIYWRHKCATTAGEGVTKDTCNYEVQISGDGGANWTTLGAYTSSKSDDWKPEKIALDAENYADFWTADFILRFRATDDKNDDTAIWDDPGAGETSSYDQTTTIDWLSVMVEFDWEYRA
jgi:hypothetical protein